jgi:anti-sigma B factor antagonist
MKAARFVSPCRSTQRHNSCIKFCGEDFHSVTAISAQLGYNQIAVSEPPFLKAAHLRNSPTSQPSWQTDKIIMEIHTRVSGTVTIIEVSGNLTIGRNEESLRETMSQLIAQEQRFVLLNLYDVPTIDSSGIGAVIKCFTLLNEQGGKLKVLRPSRMVRQLFTITGLMSVLEVHEDESTALSSF